MHTYTQPVYIFVCARTIDASVHVYACAYWMCICLCMCICIGERVYVYIYIYIYIRDLPLTMRHGGVCLISGRFLTRKMNRGFQRILLCSLIEHPHAEDI